jgi:hypothetical protein
MNKPTPECRYAHRYSSCREMMQRTGMGVKDLKVG